MHCAHLSYGENVAQGSNDIPAAQGETQQPQEQIIEEIIYPEQHSEDGQQQQQQPQDASPASNRGRIGFIGAGQVLAHTQSRPLSQLDSSVAEDMRFRSYELSCVDSASLHMS